MRLFSKRTAVTALSIALILTVAVLPAVAAATVPNDVPKGHWAYDAVTLLINKGYMSVYESGQFRGDDPVNRYLLAFVAANLLRDIESGRTSVSSDEMEVVRQLSLQLRDELVVMNLRLSDIEEEAAALKKGSAITNENLVRQYMEISKKVEDQYKQVSAEVRAQQDAVQRVSDGINAQQAQVNAMQDQQSRLVMDLADTTKTAQSGRTAADAAGTAVSDLSLKLDGEKRTRETAELKLAADIDAVRSSLTATSATLSGRIDEESRLREAQDSKLMGDLVTLRTDIEALVDTKMGSAEKAGAEAVVVGVDSERRAREASDAKLATDIQAAEAKLAADIEAAKSALTASLAIVSKDLDTEKQARVTDSAKLAGDLAALKKDIETLINVKTESVGKEGAEALATGVDSERRAREAADAKLALDIEAEKAARQEEARKILEDLTAVRGEIKDLDKKTALADAAILAQLETERTNLTALSQELAALKTNLVALEDQSKSLSDRIAKKEADDLKTAAKILENSVDNRSTADLLAKTRESLNKVTADLASTRAQADGIAESLAPIDARLTSMEKMMQGNIDELKKRFADDLVVERWEAEAREVKLQAKIEELETRVGQLEAQKAETDKSIKSASSMGVIGIVVGIVAAIAGLLVGGGSK